MVNNHNQLMVHQLKGNQNTKYIITSSNIVSPNDLVIHQEENNIQTNKLIRHININNFSPLTPGYSQSKLHGNQNTTLYNSIGKPITHSIHTINQTKIPKPKFKLQINNNNPSIKSDYILGKHLQSQSQSITTH